MIKHSYVPVIIVFVLFVFFAVPLLPLAADDIRMADVFSADEALAAATLRHLHQNDTLRLDTFSYGGLFYYLPLLALKVWGLFGEVTERVVLVVLRAACAAAGLGCLWLTFRIGRMVAGYGTGIMAAYLLLATPTFLRWSVETHPDLPQLFWMLCALQSALALCSGFSWRRLCIGVLFAGLAAGTKYGGIFLLPVLAAAVLLPTSDGPSHATAWARLKEGRYQVAMVTIPVLFVGVFAVTNPYALFNFEAFKQHLAFEREHLRFGHMFEAGRAGLSWVWNLLVLSGYAAGVFALVKTAFLLSGRDGRMSPASCVMLLWIGGYTGYLVLTANFLAMRHLLPVLAPVYILGAAGFFRLIDLFGKMLGRSGRMAMISLSLILIFGSHAIGAVELFRHKWFRLDSSAEITAGRWIGTRYPENTSIVFDAYAYVPSKYRDSFRTFGQSYPLINHFQPDVIVVRHAIANRYGNREDAERFKQGIDVFLDRHLFYRLLASGGVGSYLKVKAFSGIEIFERSARKAGYAAADNWHDRVKVLGQGQLYGLPKARQEMGDFLASGRHWLDAAREYSLAVSMKPDSAVLTYKLGRMYLEMKNPAMADQAFETVWRLVSKKTVPYKGNLRHQMSRQYFATGYDQKAIELVAEALALDEGHRNANFDMGLYHLALGNVADAKAAYRKSVKRFGRDEPAMKALRELGQRGVPSEQIGMILELYFREAL